MASYSSRIEAELGRTSLAAEGIDAQVIDAASTHPILNEAAGGTRLFVDETDAERARQVLAETARVETVDDDPDAVRCPRCELSYCFYERPRFRGASAAAGADLFAVLGSILLKAAPKRWRCAKCGHVWDDASEGPKHMTSLPEGEPKPVFRLKRTQGCVGIFLGIGLGFAASIAMHASQYTPFLLLLGGTFGWVVGGAMRRDVCSEPSCRALLPPDELHCPGCRGIVAGAVYTAEEHYAAAADYRRELRDIPESYRDTAPRKKRRRR